jgi:low affinity Fe/Cu permease
MDFKEILKLASPLLLGFGESYFKDIYEDLQEKFSQYLAELYFLHVTAIGSLLLFGISLVVLLTTGVGVLTSIIPSSDLTLLILVMTSGMAVLTFICYMFLFNKTKRSSQVSTKNDYSALLKSLSALTDIIGSSINTDKSLDKINQRVERMEESILMLIKSIEKENSLNKSSNEFNEEIKSY